MNFQFREVGGRVEGFWMLESDVGRAVPRAKSKRAGSPVTTDVLVGDSEDRVGYWSPDEHEEESDRRQFVALYLNPASGCLELPVSSKVQPALAGSSEKPDVKVKIDLEALHIPKEGGARSGTVRVQFSQDGKFTEGRDALHWVVAAGLDLYGQSKAAGAAKPLKPSDVKADLTKPFAGRAISLPGGAGYLRIDVLQDRKRSILENLWKSIVDLLTSPSGVALAATVGFPAIALPAVSFVDGLIGQLRGLDDSDVVIKGRETKFAFNSRGLEKLKLGAGNRVEYPVMNEGFYVLLQAGDLEAVATQNPWYLGGYGLLVPESRGLAETRDLEKYVDEYAQGRYPFKDIAYAVISVQTQEADVYKEWM